MARPNVGTVIGEIDGYHFCCITCPSNSKSHAACRGVYCCNPEWGNQGTGSQRERGLLQDQLRTECLTTLPTFSFSVCACWFHPLANARFAHGIANQARKLTLSIRQKGLLALVRDTVSNSYLCTSLQPPARKGRGPGYFLVPPLSLPPKSSGRREKKVLDGMKSRSR